MTIQMPWSEACERNREPIWAILRNYLPPTGTVLEIGSCTGQHVVHFAGQSPGLTWLPSDQADYLEGLRSRLVTEGSRNILPAAELDVLAEWPAGPFDAVYTANTAHIMSWQAVCAMFAGVSVSLVAGGRFCLYGPFNLNGNHTAASNAQFDHQLKSRNPQMGLRDVEALDSLANRYHLRRISRHEMPANNMVLVFQQEPGRNV